MLNSTEVIQYIEKNLGFQLTDLELTHDEIINNIRKDSLRTFSKYFPNTERVRVGKEDLVEGYQNMYYLNTETDCVNVNRVIHSSLLGANAVTDMLHPTAMAMMYGDPISRQLESDVVSTTKNPVTFVYYHPNKVEITPMTYATDHFIVVCNTIHADHFGTIPENLREVFLDLCLYDTQMSLYAIRSRFNNLQTTFGSIELFLDELREARDRRKELIEVMYRDSIKSARRKKIIIA